MDQFNHQETVYHHQQVQPPNPPLPEFGQPPPDMHLSSNRPNLDSRFCPRPFLLQFQILNFCMQVVFMRLGFASLVVFCFPGLAGIVCPDLFDPDALTCELCARV